MSLINEALKKAQQDRPQESTPVPPSSPGGPPNPPQPKETRQPKGFLWGFILAVLIVGSVSSLLAAYLVLQLIDPQADSPPPEPAVVDQAEILPEPEVPESSPLQTVKIEEPAKAKEAESIPAMIEELPAIASSETKEPSSLSTAKQETLTPEPQTVGQETRPVQPQASQPVPPAVTYAPNPEVVARLRELEIRGVMSGATKVLIHDTSTGKTKAFREEESLEGTMGLVIVSISNNKIEFRDYAGQIHSKSF